MSAEKAWETEGPGLARIRIRRCDNGGSEGPIDEIVIDHQEFYPEDYFDAARLFIKRGMKLLADRQR